MALNQVGFAHVYGVAQAANHPDLKFEWRDNLDASRDGHNLRCMFVASRAPIDRPKLVPLPAEQE